MTKDRIFEIIIGHTREVIPELQGYRFQPDDALKDLGANSIDRSEIVAMTIESLALNIPLTETARAKNIDELAGLLYEKSQSC